MLVALQGGAAAQNGDAAGAAPSAASRRLSFQAETTTVKALMRRINRGPHVPQLRDPAADADWPFFVVFEGIEIEWKPEELPPAEDVPEPVLGARVRYVPAESDRRIKVALENGTVADLARAIEQSVPTLRTSIEGNVLLIQDVSLAEKSDWLLNEVVPECRDADLYWLDAVNLLRERYGWKAEPYKPSSEAKARYGGRIVMKKSHEPVTVRQLMLAVLRVEAIRLLEKRPASIACYDVFPAGRRQDGWLEWTVTRAGTD